MTRMYRKLPFQGGDPRLVAEVVNNLVEGKSNNSGEITLNTGGATTTTLFNERIGFESIILLDPLTETAADTRQPYGEFSNLATQTFAVADTIYNVDLSTTEEAYATSLGSNRITVEHGGTYNLLFSLQFANSSSNAIGEASVWLRINGTDVPDSAFIKSIPSSHAGGDGYALMTSNVFLQLAANDYVEVMVAVSNTDVVLQYNAAQATPYVKPTTPSAIVTLNIVAPVIAVWVNERQKGQATLQHLPNYYADKTFGYIIVG